MNPWSPSPCTVGARRATIGRTPRSANASAASALATRGCALGSGRSSSVPGRLGHPREVVVVAEVDDALAVRGGGAQALDVVELTAPDLCAERGDLLGRGVRAGQADDLVARLQQLGNGGRADPARSPGDEDTHGKAS